MLYAWTTSLYTVIVPEPGPDDQTTPSRKRCASFFVAPGLARQSWSRHHTATRVFEPYRATSIRRSHRLTETPMQIEVENALSDLEYAEHRMESLDTDVLSAIGEKAALYGLQIMIEMVVVRQRKALQSYYERYGVRVTITG